MREIPQGLFLLRMNSGLEGSDYELSICSRQVDRVAFLDAQGLGDCARNRDSQAVANPDDGYIFLDCYQCTRRLSVRLALSIGRDSHMAIYETVLGLRVAVVGRCCRGLLRIL